MKWYRQWWHHHVLSGGILSGWEWLGMSKRDRRRQLTRDSLARQHANGVARFKRAAARDAKQAARAQGHDVFGSNARRAAQAAKDARELAAPVASGFTPGGKAFLALKPFVPGAGPRTIDPVEGVMRRLRKKLRRGRGGLHGRLGKISPAFRTVKRALERHDLAIALARRDSWPAI